MIRVVMLRALALLLIDPLLATAQDPPAGQRVYICGHSFHVMMAAPLEQIAQAAGIKDHVLAGKSILGGSSVTKHWEVPDDKNVIKTTIRQGKVDVLTLSPNGKVLPDDGIPKFIDLMLESNPKGRVLVQASWAGMDAQRSATFKNADRDKADPNEVRKRSEPINQKLTEQIQTLHKQYREKAGRQVVFLVPVGEAVLRLRERVVKRQAPGVAKQSELFRDDLGHGKPPIAVLVAYCHYAIIYQRSPVGLPVPDELKKAGLAENTEALNRVLQEVAWETVTQEPLSGVTATVGKSDKAPATEAASALEPTLGKKGRLLLEEKFDGDLLPNGWTSKAGGLRVADGVLHASQKKDAGRLCLFNCDQPMQDAAIQIDFKFDGARGINISVNSSPGELNKHGHLFSVMITLAMWNITEHNNKADRNSQSKVLVSAAERFEPGRWYTLLLETKGADVIARVHGKTPLRASSKDFGVRKPGIEFRVAGRDNEEASFDNLRVWELK